MTRYRWVAARKAEGFPTTKACRAAGVSRQAFYDWSGQQASGLSAKASADAELVAAIRSIHADSGGAYGSPRVTAELRRQGRRVNPKRVCRLMRLHGICGIHKRRKPRWKVAGGSRPAPADLVRRDFRPGQPDRVWAGDITYIPTGQGWLHLAVVLDLGSRRVVGYSMAADMAARLVVDALDTAAASRGGRTGGVIFHSDRGPQYLSGDFASALARHGMRQSAGRVANCWDNSVAESFFSSLKRELVTQTRFATRDQARREVFSWIGRYNTRRIHSTLHYQTPTEWENHHRQRLNQAA
ncbi:IS3 family transposase [Candidatus Poriferisocius sp.]|uniref:IS3 family transposase n=1 Tax=Candidatus Poriferisocius sp. TaxID=3101276 RepID=UPI003B52CD30